MKLMKDVGRECGECTACCKPFVVSEVGKMDGSWCPKCVLNEGCSIYAERPLACREYTCLWLNGKGDESWRPDRIGVMMDCEDIVIGDREVGELHLWEMWPRALDQDIIEELIDVNLDAGNIVVTHRILTESTYKARSRMPSDHFSSQEAAEYQLVISRRCTG